MTNIGFDRALVVGLGVSGLSAARFLARRGVALRVADSRAAPPQLAALQAEFPEVPVHSGGWREEWFRDPGVLVLSPGVSMKEPVVAAAARRGVPVLGDIEIFARVTRAPVIAITGANGKSTVTSLAGAMCAAAGMQVAVGGNIGVAALDLVAAVEPDVYVLELSSFQLETTASLRAQAAVVLNISPDHMDRYDSLGAYAAAKARIYAGDGTMVVNDDDALVCSMIVPGRKVVRFALTPPRAEHDYGLAHRAEEEWLARGSRLIMPTAEVPLAGRHNLANVLAAMALTEAVGVPFDAMRRAVMQFKGLRHRTELVAERDGVRWIDDSKGTNVGATAAALNGMDRPVVLIAGGDGKGADFSELRAAVAQHARAVVLIGRDAPLIERALAGVVPATHAADMTAAVRAARTLARAGDAVLLSPACASFDMFRNYEHRGQVFAAAVRELLA